MKYLIYFLFLSLITITLLYSCMSCGKSVDYEREYEEVYSPVIIDTSTIYYDTAQNIIEEEIYYSDYGVGGGYISNEHSTKSIVIMEEQPIEYTISPNLNEFISGKIGYVIDDSMTVNKISRVFMTLSMDEKNIKLSLSKQPMVYEQGNVDTNSIIFDDIKISKVMSASLIDPQNKFIITPIGDETKILMFDENKKSETWIWDVVPLEKGQYTLILNVEIVINNNGVEHKSSMTVFNENITINAEPMTMFQKLTKFINEEWKWLLSTLIIPFGIWLYRRKKK